jgi:hypothetical protein
MRLEDLSVRTLSPILEYGLEEHTRMVFGEDYLTFYRDVIWE